MRSDLGVIALSFLTACYDAGFNDCAIRCTEDTGCPEGFSCGGEGLCHGDGPIDSCLLDDGGAAGMAPPGMVLVPAGPFTMGRDSGSYPDESPAHVVALSAFYVDVDLVKNSAYKLCVAAGNCTAPSSYNSFTRAQYYGNTTYSAYPVIQVDHYQAGAYCAWAGKRLLTEAEWEKASNGSVGQREYPWGDTAPTCALANYENCLGDTSAVGAYSPDGDSPYGVHDMAGNVREWVSDLYAATYYAQCAGGCVDPRGPPSGTALVVRGGSYGQDLTYLSVAKRDSADPGSRTNSLSFRCAKSI